MLAEIAQGKSNTAIAEALFLTKRAVEKHINSIFLKLGLADAEDVSKRVKAALMFLVGRRRRRGRERGRDEHRRRLTYVGHATILIELDGVSLLTDPVLRDRIGHVSRIAPPVTGDLRPDAILVSHAHRDHLDLPSLRAAARGHPRLRPAGGGGARRGAGPAP